MCKNEAAKEGTHTRTQKAQGYPIIQRARIDEIAMNWNGPYESLIYWNEPSYYFIL